ncbi:lipase family protein [Ekhidna sp.]|uniref:alpha/beta hydrolase family protein n=1 Tax=Ekhidna sp. TaxID=2608089 RepID=UPI00329946C3
MNIISLLIPICTALLISSCSKESISAEPNCDSRGCTTSVELVGTYSPQTISQIIASSGVNVSMLGELTYSVDLNRVVYRTIDALGNEVEASGVILVPRNTNHIPMLSIQHGAVFHRNNVCSESILNGGEGLVGMLMASKGYGVVIPDYLGYGVSEMIHPYLNEQLSASVTIDAIRSARHHIQSQGVSLIDQLFLYGYSEGGYVTLATQKVIETDYSDEFSLTAVAPMAGPYDLEGTLSRLFEERNYDHLPNLAFVLTSFDAVNNWGKLDHMFKAPYNQLVTDLFSGNHNNDEIRSALPNNLPELIREEFIVDFLTGQESEVSLAFSNNSLLNWSPVAPVRLYHGDLDEEVPFHNAQTALDRLKANGGNVELFTIQGADHQTANVPSVLAMIEWFETLRL